MKRLHQLAAIALFCFLATAAMAGDKPIFGPVQYDVKERYGRENRYQIVFSAPEGSALIKLQNGDQSSERAEFMELIVNGEKLLKDERYEYRFIAGSVELKKENTCELMLKDAQPASLKRPVLPPRFVTLSVIPLPMKLAKGAYGLYTWDALPRLAGLLQKIKDPASAGLAATSVNLQQEAQTRAGAVRKLSDRKDETSREFITALYTDAMASPSVRGEAALALGVLGDKTSVPLLINGMLDSDENVRLGSTRALSFYKEEETIEPLANVLGRIDAVRRDTVIKSIENIGWKPVGTFIKLAESSDAQVADMAIGLLGKTKSPRAVALLLKLFEQPGRRRIKTIIVALGETGDSLAVEPLARMVKNTARRSGYEVELGEALANLGDAPSAEVIVEMIKNVQSVWAQDQLRQAYKKLTGKDIPGK